MFKRLIIPGIILFAVALSAGTAWVVSLAQPDSEDRMRRFLELSGLSPFARFEAVEGDFWSGEIVASGFALDYTGMAGAAAGLMPLGTFSVAELDYTSSYLIRYEARLEGAVIDVPALAGWVRALPDSDAAARALKAEIMPVLDEAVAQGFGRVPATLLVDEWLREWRGTYTAGFTLVLENVATIKGRIDLSEIDADALNAWRELATPPWAIAWWRPGAGVAFLGGMARLLAPPDGAFRDVALEHLALDVIDEGGGQGLLAIVDKSFSGTASWIGAGLVPAAQNVLTAMGLTTARIDPLMRAINQIRQDPRAAYLRVHAREPLVLGEVYDAAAVLDAAQRRERLGLLLESLQIDLSRTKPPEPVD